MPFFRNSFIDPKRSYLRFDFKLNSAASRVFRSSVAPFRRMTIRDSRGTIFEDITEYNYWVKVKDVLKTEAELKSELATTRSNYVMGANAVFSSPVPVVH